MDLSFLNKHPDPRFLEAIKLFNDEEYFESHEVMESLWLETPKLDPYRDLYKGVIQVAAAILLRRKEVMGGGDRLAKTALQYLSKYRYRSFELDVMSLVQDLDEWIHQEFNTQTRITMRISC